MYARWSPSSSRTTSAVLLTTWLVAAAAFAAEPARKGDPKKPSGPPTFSLEHALTLKTIQGITWSRDGRRVAFVVTAPDTAEDMTNQDIWLWDASFDSCRQVTRH